MRYTTIAFTICALILSAGLGGAVGAEEPIVIRFSHVVGENTPKGIGANRFKQKVEQRLAGRVRVEVYPRSQRFPDEQVLTALLFDDVQMAAPSLTQLRGFAKAMQVFELPFLFKDTAHLHRFQAGPTGQRLLAAMEPRGIRGLAYWDNGFRAIATARPVRLPEDARGMAFRLEPSAVFQEQYARVGVVGIQMPFGQVADALRRGLVDGMENSWSNIEAAGIYPLLGNYLQLDHSVLGYMVVTSDAFWKGLPDDVRTVLEAVLAEVTAEVNGLAEDNNAQARARIGAPGGATIDVPPAEVVEQWRQAFVPVWETFTPVIGADVIAAAVAAGDSR